MEHLLLKIWIIYRKWCYVLNIAYGVVYVTYQLGNDSLVISSMIIWFLKVALNFENITCCKNFVVL